MKKLLIAFLTLAASISFGGLRIVSADLYEAKCSKKIPSTQDSVDKLNQVVGADSFTLRHMEANSNAPAQTWIDTGPSAVTSVLVANETINNLPNEDGARRVCPALGFETIRAIKNSDSPDWND